MITYEREKDGTLKQVDSPPKRAELVEQRIYDRCLARVGQLEAEKATLEARIDELCAEVERLRQENQSISMAAYEVGYKNGSVHYELEHCPACKNVADLQEALDENAKLRELVKAMTPFLCCMPFASCNTLAANVRERMRELGIEVA